MGKVKPIARKCQLCGCDFESAHPSKVFCTDACKQAWGNFMASRGKVLMPLALAWRTGRGRKGPAAEAMKEMVRFLDACAAELAAGGAQPIAKHYERCRQSGNGIRTHSEK
jgi:hypothetical protein